MFSHYFTTDLCPAGFFSGTGFAPCSWCVPGTYQPITGQTGCIPCPDGLTTSTYGSDSTYDCQGNIMVESCHRKWNKERLVPRSHLHVKPAGKSHVRLFAQNGMGRGYLVVVTGSTWLWRDAQGNLPASGKYKPRNSHVEPVIAKETP